MALPTVAIRGPFSSFPVMIGARGTGTTPSIAAIPHRPKLVICAYIRSTKALLIVLLQCNIYLMEENSLPGIVLTLIARKSDMKLFSFCLHSIGINTVVCCPMTPSHHWSTL